MQPFESLEAVKAMLSALMEREEPLARELPPSPGSRAERYMQLLAPDAHLIDPPATAVAIAATVPGGSAISLSERVTRLEAETTQLRDVVSRFAQMLGEPDPFAAAPEPSLEAKP